MSSHGRPHYGFLDNGGLPIASANRGGADCDPQTGIGFLPTCNTKRAFDDAYKKGYRYMDTDAALTGDGQIVATAVTDSYLESTRFGIPYRPKLRTQDYRQFSQSYRRLGEPIPLLGDVIGIFSNVRFNITVQEDEVVEPLADLILDLGAADRVCLNAPRYRRTKAVAELIRDRGEDVCTAIRPLGFVAVHQGKLRAASEIHSRAANAGAACLQLPYYHASNHMVESAHDRGLDFHAYTNNITEMNEAVDRGLEGITTDSAAVLRAVLLEKDKWPDHTLA